MQITKEQLCDSCRKLHPVTSEGKPWKESVEDLLMLDAYKHPAKYIGINYTILTTLEDNGGCSRCIDLLNRATQ